MFAYLGFWLHRRDRYHALSPTYNFGTETLLGGGDTTVFVVPSAAIDRALPSTFVASKKLTALTKGPPDSDHTAMIGVIHWRLHGSGETHHAGEVVRSVIVSGCHWHVNRAQECASREYDKAAYT